MAKETLSIRCLEITQPIGKFYIGVMDCRDLIDISYADVRSMSERAIAQYSGIERPLDPKRVEELRDYVNAIDATFPTGVILAIKSKHARYHEGKLHIDKDEEVAKIIDGQHRIAGLEGFDGNKFEVNVVIFIDMDMEDQAMVFATINLAQTKVSKSLVYDLYEYTKSRSPTKTCHNIARLLNVKEGSPFCERIKILGTATQPHQTLTQAAVVEALLRLISGDPHTAGVERDIMRRGRELDRAPDSETVQVFRNMFIDEMDAEIARVVWNYFDAVRDKWSEAWGAVDKRGNMLPRTNGFKGLVRFLPSVYLRLGGPGLVPSKARFLSVLAGIDLNDDDFNVDRYPPGTTGETRLANDLEALLHRIQAQ